MVKFTSHYRIRPKLPLPADPVIIPEVAMPKPPPIARTGSIKINTKGGATRTGLPGAPPKPTALPTLSDTIVASSNTPRRPGATPKASETPTSAVKRPRSEDSQPLATAPPKRPKIESPSPGFDGLESITKRRLVTLKTKHPNRLAVLLGVPAPNGTVRKALPGAAPKESASPSPHEITAKPRKPLPGAGDGTPSRKPLPGLSSSTSTPTPAAPPKPTINTTVANVAKPAVAGGTSGSPPPATPGSARPKIKIVRKPPPPPS